MNVGIAATIAYGVISIIGGIMGYLKAGSKVSLISGGISGIVLLVLGTLYQQGQTWALVAAMGVTGLLILVFLMRWLKTRKPMPAMLMIVLGAIALGLMILQWAQASA